MGLSQEGSRPAPTDLLPPERLRLPRPPKPSQTVPLAGVERFHTSARWGTFFTTQQTVMGWPAEGLVGGGEGSNDGEIGAAVPN